MNSLELLRKITWRTFPQASVTGPVTHLPAAALRFVLEYDSVPTLQAEQQRLAAVLPSARFILGPVAAALPQFLVLQFPDVERTLSQRSLYEVAYALCEELSIVSVEPDLGADLFRDPVPADPNATMESVAGLSALCQASGAPPTQRAWAAAKVKASEAWEYAKGQGILVGQPDTGVAEHVELNAGMLRKDLGWDLINGTQDPVDPLSPHMANPGHGTATASVVASATDGGVTGIAPQAQVVPIRCIEDVKVANQAPVAAAIAHAQAVGCHVITMSLGGLPSRALHAAVRNAVLADVIVLAAAGNCARIVVFPARYDEVIAVAGTNEVDQPWKGSCRGNAVDVSAPAEFVYRAKRNTQHDPVTGVEPSQGTSYAVAIVAGIAALWLSYHGRDRIIQQARKRGVSVQALFKAALQATAWQPDEWDGARFGAGIADAKALLELDLDNIPVVAHEFASTTIDPVQRMLIEEAGGAAMAPGFDWRRYGSELAAITLSHAKIGGDIAQVTVESKSFDTLPSPTLAEVVKLSGNDVLQRFGTRNGETQVARPAFEPRLYPPPHRALRKALALQHTGLEVTAMGFQPVKAMEYLKGGGIRAQLDRLETIVNMETTQVGVKATVLNAAQEALEDTVGGRNLTSVGRFGFEALVRLTGRPALKTKDGTINIDDPRASEWRSVLHMAMQDGLLMQRIQSVGRIDLDGIHIGTGFVVGDGLVLTNRHVLQAIAVPVPTSHNPTEWLLTDPNITIDFSDRPKPGNAASRFRIVGVAAAGAQHISDSVLDYSAFDAALLRLGNSDGAPFPRVIPLRRMNGLLRPDVLFAVGYPARPELPLRPDGNIDEEVSRRLNELFDDYSVRYLSPGEVMASASGNRADKDFLTLRHDATTLGGSSGSAVLEAGPELKAAGLHFAGSWLRENMAHSLPEAFAADVFLARAAVDWRE